MDDKESKAGHGGSQLTLRDYNITDYVIKNGLKITQYKTTGRAENIK